MAKKKVAEEEVVKEVVKEYKLSYPKVISPEEVIPGSKMFVEMGPYNDEIKSELKNIIFI